MGVNDEITTEVIGMIDNDRQQDHARRIHSIEGVAPTQNAHSGGGLETKIAEPDENTDGKKVSIISRPHGYYKGGEYEVSHCVKSSAMAENNYVKVQKDNMPCEPSFRIRKLTPRECFRLMGCDEPTIDKLLNSGISNSQLYKLAGNSIVVDVLYNILRKLITEQENECRQMTLF